MNKMDLGKFFKFILSKWNIIVAATSVVGVLIFNFIPQSDNFLKLFVFLGINAIVWTIIEIKLKLDEKKLCTTERFNDIRHARSFILEHIYQCMKTNKSEELCVEIIANRFKVSGDMIRDIRDRIVKKEIVTRNVTIRIYAVNPEFIRHWNFLKTQSINNFKERNEDYASFIELTIKELLKYNELTEFKSNNIKIKVEFYNMFPSIYSYKIGCEHIYWGFFTWDNSTDDFSVPGSHPCYYLEKNHAHFNDFSRILSNTVEFYQSYQIENRL